MPFLFNQTINLLKNQDFSKLKQILVYLLFFSLFFPIRHVFPTLEAYLTGDYSDFTSFSLYLSDILIFILWFVFIIPRGKVLNMLSGSIKWLILWISISFFANFSKSSYLSLFLLFKWFELIVTYETFKVIFRETSLKIRIFRLFVWLCAVQSIIAILQFVNQKSLGFSKIGESVLDPLILGVAKIVSSGTVFIRGYGTFPHPNPLSAFLVVGILIGLYLLVKSLKTADKITYSMLVFINIFGLTITFSRAGYLSLILAGMVFLVLLAKKFGLNSIKRHLIILTLSAITIFLIFKPFLISRSTGSDGSTFQRNFYNQTGLRMISQNPIFGVGLGESLLHMEQYSGILLAPWDKQPPHNYFIIAGAELGIIGFLLIIWVFMSHLWRLVKKYKITGTDEFTAYYALLISIFTAFIILMQFDHYFFTLEQTQLLFWLFLGLFASEIKNPQEGN